MRIRRTVAVLVGAAALSLAGMSVASAATPSAITCSGGNLPSGKVLSLTVKGPCVLPDGGNLTVLGNVVVAPGAALDASTHSTLLVTGNVLAGRGSLLQLGCTDAHPCDDGQPGTIGDDVVKGNVTLNHVFGAAIDGVTIGGNLVSGGGGPGVSSDMPFPVKDNRVAGNIEITNLSDGWYGVIRNVVGGNILLRNNTSDGVGDYHGDADEVVANQVGGNLICGANTPAPQFGDAVAGAPPGYGPNLVRGRALGQCSGLAGGAPTPPPV